MDGEPEFSAIQAFLNNTYDAQKAVNLITTRTKEFVDKPTELANHVWVVASSVLQLATQHPEKQDQIIDLLELLQQQELVSEATGEPVKNHGDLVWRDLSMIGVIYADELGSIIPWDADVSPETEHNWEATVNFASKLTARGVHNLGFFPWALTAFNAAFDDEDSKVKEISLRMACLWYINASAKLMEWFKDDTKEDFEMADWVKWKAALKAAKDGERALGEGTKELVEKAWKTVEEVEV